MAIIYPDLENIQRLKVSPTAGEWQLVNFLNENLDNTYEVFFNPFLDGDRPDIIILKEDALAFIIEVKDWKLSNYRITEFNKWKVSTKKANFVISSPHSQAFRYKKNLYDLHLPVVGLARLINPNFFNLVKCYVYFHNSDKNDINSLYLNAENSLKENKSSLEKRFHENLITFNHYNAEQDKILRRQKNINRDKAMSFGSDYSSPHKRDSELEYNH